MRIVFFILLIFFTGCGGSKYFYWDVNLSTKAKKEIPLSLNFPDYMKSGYVVAKDGEKLIFLKKEIPESVEKFYGGYLRKSLKKYGIDAKNYPWDYENKPKKIFFVNIYDYYVDLKNKEAVLKAECCNRYFDIKKKYKKEWMGAYKGAFDEFIKKLGGLL